MFPGRGYAGIAACGMIGYDYIVVPLTSGTLRLEESTGAREVRLEAGASYARSAGNAHKVVNVNPHVFCFIEIELV